MTIDPTSIDALALERAWVEIDVAALAHNIRELQRLIHPSTALMAVVKANAYGHGAVRVAQIAQSLGVQCFGVATLPEGIELRQGGITQPIVLLGAAHSEAQIQAIIHWHLQPTLCTLEQAQRFSDRLSKPLPVHLKIDTGMSRLGHPWQTGADFVQQAGQLPHLAIASVYSHLATADAPDPSFMQEQQVRFEEVVGRSRAAGMKIPCCHLANSAGTLFGPSLHYDMVRVGLALYGLYPGAQFQQTITLKPVMQVRARITQIKSIPAGTGVSYNHRFVTPTAMTLAVVGIGYADGVPRNLSNCMDVLIRGRRVRQLGTITMDQLIIDISAIPDAQVGDCVTLLGQDGSATIGAETWSDQLDTISYEIVCGIQSRLLRNYVNFNR